MIDFLERFKYLALVIVVLSVPAFAFIAFMVILFCDSGPISLCFRVAGIIIAVPVAQVSSLVMAWIMLKKRRYIFVSAGLMLFSILPPIAGIVFFIRR
jgi:CBS domain containing-hemolysin-like protein